MKVLLIKDVKALGKAGEIKEVKDGYGNNFLIGKGFAKAATPDVLRQYEAAQKRKAEELKYEIASDSCRQENSWCKWLALWLSFKRGDRSRA